MRPSEVPTTDPDGACATLLALCDPFMISNLAARSAEVITPEAMPEWERNMLVHRDHMTTKLQQEYGPIRLFVRREMLVGDIYSRYILLVAEDINTTVEVGACRIDLRQTPDAVRKEIIDRTAPLGDILIRHDVLRSVEPRWFWRFTQGSPFLREFYPHPAEAYGRVGRIHCNGSPAIDLLEIVSPADIGTNNSE